MSTRTQGSDASSAKDAPPYPSRGYSWYVVGVLCIAYTLSFIDRQILAFLVGPIRADFDIDDFQFSIIHGLGFVVFYTIMGIPLGRLADSRNRRSIIGVGIAAWSAMTAACGLAGSYVQLLLARIGVGVGEAALSPAAYSIISDSFPKEKRALPTSLYSAGVLAGAGLANVFGGLIVQYAIESGTQTVPVIGEVKPWQMAFLIVGLPGLLIAMLMVTVKEPFRREKRSPESQARFADTVKFVGQHWVVYFTLIFAASFFAMTNYGLMSWVPAMFERVHGWNRAQIGPYFGGIIFVFGTLGLAVSGYVAGRMIEAGKKAVHSKLMLGAMLAAALPMLFMNASGDPYWTLACIGLIMFCLGFPVGLAPAALQAISPNEMRGQVIAIYFFILNIMGLGIGTSAIAALTNYYFADDAAVGSSIVVIGFGAIVLGILALVLGLRATVRMTEEIERT